MKFSFSVFFMCSAIARFSFGATPGQWEFVKDQDGVKVSRMEVQGSRVLAFRGEGDVEGDMAKVASVVFDTTRAPEWIPDLEESKILKWIDTDTFIEYDHIGTPFVVKDREFVSEVKIQVDQTKHILSLVFHSTTQDELAPKTHYVRGDLMNTTFIFSPGSDEKHTHVVGEIHVDPRGNIPNWLANFFQKSWPVDTFNGLKKQLQKTDLQVNDKIASKITLLGETSKVQK